MKPDDIDTQTLDKDAIINALQKEVDSLRLIISKTPGNVYWKNIDGSYLGCNMNVANVLNLDSPKDIIGKTDVEVIGPELAKKALKIDQEVLTNCQEKSLEEIGFNAAGEEAIYLTRKTPLLDRHGNIQGILGISFDITERKHIEEKLTIAKQKAESANRAKTRFLAAISHELRTPLASILGFANLIEQPNVKNEKIREYANHIINSGSYLLSLINSILDYNKLETNNFKLDFSPLNLKELTQNVISMLNGSAKLKNLEINLDYDESLPALIMGDSRALQQILINLIGNALKFTIKGHVTIRIKCLNSSADKVNLQIAVEDSGIGIPEHEQQSIFKRFYQLGDVYTRKTNLGGTGLGLSIVKKLVKLIGGKIEVKSVLTEGSTFFLTANFSIAPTNAPLAHTEPKQFPVQNILSQKPYVLVIEDNHLIQIIHKHLLEELGCEVDVTGSANKSLEMLVNNYDILFVDLGLPDIAGFELIKTIRQKSPHLAQIPIIVLTSYSEESELDHCLEAGANEVIIKPVSKEILAEIIDKYIDSHLRGNDKKYLT